MIMATAENKPNKFPIRTTAQEHLAWDANQSRPHEYYDGKVHPRRGDAFARAGARRVHDRIVSNLVWRLKDFLPDRPCDVFTSDTRLALSTQTLFYDPDVMAGIGSRLISRRAMTRSNCQASVARSASATFTTASIYLPKNYFTVA